MVLKIQPDKQMPWLAGLLLTANVYLVPVLASSPRATDLGGLLLGFWALARLVQGRQDPRPLATLGIAALAPLVWLFFSTLNGDSATGILAARWLLAVPWALALVLITEDQERLVHFAWGIVAGALVNTAVIVLQWKGLESLLQMIGLSSSGANYHQYVLDSVRIPGLHGHHNASSSVISLLVPAGFYLYLKGRCRISFLLAFLFALLVSLHLTSTRSPLIVSVLTVGFASLLARRLGRSIILGFVIASFLIPLVVVYGPPGGWARWKNTEALVSNANERSESTLGSAALCVQNPLGLGVDQGRFRLGEKTGLGATHNAFLQAALVFSLPFGLLVTFGILRMILRSLGGVDQPLFLPGLMAFQTAGLFMFEEHLNNPTFIIMAMWLITLSFHKIIRTEKSPAD